MTLRNHLISLGLFFCDLKIREFGDLFQICHYPLIFYDDNRQVYLCTYVYRIFHICVEVYLSLFQKESRKILLTHIINAKFAHPPHFAFAILSAWNALLLNITLVDLSLPLLKVTITMRYSLILPYL